MEKFSSPNHGNEKLSKRKKIKQKIMVSLLTCLAIFQETIMVLKKL